MSRIKIPSKARRSRVAQRKPMHTKDVSHPLKKTVSDTVSLLKKRRDLLLQQELKRSEEQAGFLAKAGEILSSSLDYETTLKSVANLIVPRLAEWCTVDILGEDGVVRQLALAHADPKMVRYAKDLARKYPPQYTPERGIGKIMRTGKVEFVPVITDEMLVAGMRDKEHLRIIRNLGLSSYMGVPLIVRGRALGVISLFMVKGKYFTNADVVFTQALASRAALAIDNARLYKESSHFAAMIASSSDAILSKTLDGIITSWNPGAQRLYGYTPQEVIGKHVSILTPSELSDDIPSILKKLRKGGIIDHYETRRVTKSGKILNVSLSVSPIKDPHGTIIGASAIARDITELVETRDRARKSAKALKILNAELEERVQERSKELKEALDKDRANLYRLKTMMEHLPIGALMMDEKDEIIELNERYCELFHIGMSASEAMGITNDELNERFLKSLLHPDTHMQKVSDTMEKGKSQFGFDIYLKDGRIVQRDFLPIYDAGVLRGRLFLYRDVTKERRIDAAKSEFMSLASHQLRTPLTAIRWSYGRLHKNLSGKVGELEKRMLEDGKIATARMSDTINTMLQISRIQANQVEINRENIRLRDFLQEVVDAHRDTILQKILKVEIECSVHDFIQTDTQLLREVVSNLFANACKYTPNGGSICLSVAKRRTSMEIHVRDSGYGIPAHQQSKVFHKFFRGDNVVSKDPDGTGLGLYLVSLITNLLGGTIDFTSAEGRGTTFTLTLPAGKK